MTAKEFLEDLEKKYNAGKIDRQLHQEDEAFKMMVNDVEFIGIRVVSHYFIDGVFTYASTHFNSDGYEWLQIDLPKDNPEYSHHQLTYDNVK
tara:strand:+ start:11615 stop:11890 length:276 start_codon:yes stop_codon:yes gene_type:complete